MPFDEDFFEEMKSASVRGLAPAPTPINVPRRVLPRVSPRQIRPTVVDPGPLSLEDLTVLEQETILDNTMQGGLGIMGMLPWWLAPVAGAAGGWLLGQLGGQGQQITPGQELNTLLQQGMSGVLGQGQAFDEGGFVTPGQTTTGTGFISPLTERAWDPIQQRFYQLTGNNAGIGRTLSPGAVIPGRGVITKGWITSARRRDGSLATTQMAMTSDGRMVSLAETGRMKTWRPYRSIVIGKSLTTSNVKRVARRVKSHVKGLKKVLSVLK